MKCFNCGKSEAVFSEDSRAGLCSRCLNEASQNRSHLIGTQRLGVAAGAMLFVGAALYFLGGRLDAPVVTAKLNLVQTTGLALAAAGGLYLHLRNLLAPSMLRRTPWKIMGNWPNATLNPVPVGDGYYRNYRDFKAINPFLGKEISEKIYSEIIEIGAWRTMVEGNKE